MICQSHEEALLWVILRADLGEQSIVFAVGCRSNGSRESGSRSLALAIRVNDLASMTPSVMLIVLSAMHVEFFWLINKTRIVK